MKRILLLFLLISSSVACVKIEHATDRIDVNGEITNISLVIPPLNSNDESEVETKMTANKEGSKTYYYWALTDTVAIFPKDGCQLYFSMADGVGSTTVRFDGGGWGLRGDVEYFSYFPFVPDYYVDKEAVPISFLGQKQKGNATETYGDIGDYWYMTATGTLSQNGNSLSFEYSPLGLLHRIHLPVVAGSYESLSLNTGEEILVSEGTFNCIDRDGEIHNSNYTDEITVELEDVVFNTSGTLIVYMVTSPFQNLGGQITYNLKRNDGVSMTASTVGKNYTVGSANQKPNISIYPSSASLSGGGESVNLNIISNGSSYEVSTDVNWLTLNPDPTPTSGSSVISVTASENPGVPRKGHVIVSEKVIYKDVEYVLQNVMTISQSINGMNVDLKDWGNGEMIEGQV